MSFLWIKLGTVLTLIGIIGKLIWTFYGKSIQERYKPRADKHVKYIANKMPRLSEPDAKVAPTKEEESPLAKLDLNPPDYQRDYREDILYYICDNINCPIRWKWQWCATCFGKDKPDAGEVWSLQACCPSCGKPMTQRVESQWVVYECRRCKYRCGIEDDLDRVHEDTAWEIARRASDPSEWQQAPENIRAAQDHVASEFLNQTEEAGPPPSSPDV